MDSTMLVALFSLLLGLSVHDVWGVTCECDPAYCEDEDSLKRKCKGGLVYEPVCSCCQICARIEGEGCGGMWSPLTLLCDEGLVCVDGTCMPAPKTTAEMKKIAPVQKTTAEFPTRWQKTTAEKYSANKGLTAEPTAVATTKSHWLPSVKNEPTATTKTIKTIKTTITTTTRTITTITKYEGNKKRKKKSRSSITTVTTSTIATITTTK